MNYLAMCQRVRELAGIAGTGPAAVSGQSGINAKLVNWVAQAWEELQTTRTDWMFRRVSHSFTAAAGDNSYPIVAQLGLADCEEIVRESVRCYRTTETVSNQTRIDFVIWQDWIDGFENNAWIAGRPTIYTVSPDQTLYLSQTPDADYTVKFDYVRQAQTLAANGDTPTGLPEQYHMAIVYLALRYYAAHDDAVTVYQDADAQFKRILGRMRQTQAMPMQLNAEPLA